MHEFIMDADRDTLVDFLVMLYLDSKQTAEMLEDKPLDDTLSLGVWLGARAVQLRIENTFAHEV